MKPAHVDDALRNRIYALQDGGSPESASAARDSAESPDGTKHRIDRPASSEAMSPVETAQEWSESTKKNYVDTKQSRVLPLAMTAVIAFLLVLAGLRGLGPFNSSHPLASWLGMSSGAMAEANSNQEEDRSSNTQTATPENDTVHEEATDDADSQNVDTLDSPELPGDDLDALPFEDESDDEVSTEADHVVTDSHDTILDFDNAIADDGLDDSVINDVAIDDVPREEDLGSEDSARRSGPGAELGGCERQWCCSRRHGYKCRRVGGPNSS